MYNLNEILDLIGIGDEGLHSEIIFSRYVVKNSIRPRGTARTRSAQRADPVISRAGAKNRLDKQAGHIR